MHGNTMFSALDAASGYFSIPITDPVSRSKLAFCLDGIAQLQPTRLPQGVRLAPRVFVTVANIIKAQLDPSNFINYIDDWVVASDNDVRKHIRLLKTLFERFRMGGLMLKPSKCHFFQEKVEFLGLMMSSEGMTPDERNVEKVKNMKPPKTKKQVRQFLGLCGFMRRLILYFAHLASPLTNLLKAETVFKWTDIEDKAFTALKTAITEKPIITHPNFDTPFIIYSDCSIQCIGGMLGQKENGILHPIGYYSRKLSANEAVWPMHELEAHALLCCLENWMSITKHSEVHCYTDSLDAKVILQNNRQPSLRRVKLTARLGQFDNVTIHYIKGEANKAADCLSRLEVTESESDQEDNVPIIDKTGKVNADRIRSKGIKRTKRSPTQQIMEETARNHRTSTINAIDDVQDPEIHTGKENTIPKTASSGHSETNKELSEVVWDIRSMIENQSIIQEFRQGILDDSFYGVILRYLETGNFDVDMTVQLRRLFITAANQYRIKETLLWHFSKEDGRLKLVVPVKLRRRVLQSLHTDLAGGHRGVLQTIASLSRYFFWKSMANDVRAFISDCQTCGLCKRPNKYTKPEMKHVPISSPLARWSVDNLQDLKITKNGNKHILVCVESVTRLMVAVPLKDLKAETVAYALINNVFTIYGFPTELRSDNGPCFRSKLLAEFNKLTDIHHAFTLAFSSRSNGIAERKIQTLQRALQCYVNSEQNDWDYYLNAVVFSINTSVCRSNSHMNDTPAFLTFGRDLRIPLYSKMQEASPVSVNETQLTTNTYKEDKVMKLQDAIKHAYEVHDKMNERYKQYFDRNAEETQFRIGDRCYMFRPAIDKGKSRALSSQFRGPFRITDVTDTMAKLVPCVAPQAKPKWINVRRLKLVTENYTPTYKECEMAVKEQYFDELEEQNDDQIDIECSSDEIELDMEEPQNEVPTCNDYPSEGQLQESDGIDRQDQHTDQAPNDRKEDSSKQIPTTPNRAELEDVLHNPTNRYNLRRQKPALYNERLMNSSSEDNTNMLQGNDSSTESSEIDCRPKHYRPSLKVSHKAMLSVLIFTLIMGSTAARDTIICNQVIADTGLSCSLFNDTGFETVIDQQWFANQAKTKQVLTGYTCQLRVTITTVNCEQPVKVLKVQQEIKQENVSRYECWMKSQQENNNMDIHIKYNHEAMGKFEEECVNRTHSKTNYEIGKTQIHLITINGNRSTRTGSQEITTETYPTLTIEKEATDCEYGIKHIRSISHKERDEIYSRGIRIIKYFNHSRLCNYIIALSLDTCSKRLRDESRGYFVCQDESLD